MERLNKYLAHAGVGSRRHCDDLIAAGRVTVDGLVVREFGTRVAEGQRVAVDGKPIEAEKLVYWLVNKPRGYLCTNHDPDGRPRALDLVEHVSQRVYTVGRLDEDSEGLLLMTNDGDLAHKLMHPRFGVQKTYLVQVAGKPTRGELQQLLDGIWLSDGFVKAKRVKRLKSQGDSTWLEIVLAEGKNREVRRMLAKQEHKVMRLKRIAIGPLRITGLSKGKARRLHVDEVALLRRSAERPPRREEGAKERPPERPDAPPRPAARGEASQGMKRKGRKGDRPFARAAGADRPRGRPGERGPGRPRRPTGKGRP
jgi:23S rRNA pseudouridine2605 synthase